MYFFESKTSGIPPIGELVFISIMLSFFPISDRFKEISACLGSIFCSSTGSFEDQEKRKNPIMKN
jgi:hypothetical protein